MDLPQCPYYKTKKSYINGTEARAVAKKRRKKLGVKLEQYKCRYCKYWHVGHVRSAAQIRRKIKAMEKK